MNKKSNWGLLLIVLVMGVTGWYILRQQPLSQLVKVLSQIKPAFVLLGLGLMLAFVGCEAMCSKLILGRLGHKVRYKQCLGYSFTGFYVSSITPSSTGGQPAQIYYMSKDGVPAAHGSLNMMLIAVCYQVVTLVYAVAAFFFLADARKGLGGGLGLLLLYGGVVMIVLTAGMLCMMFLPNAARKLTGGVLALLVRLRVVKREEEMRRKLEDQMAEYHKGAACIKENLSVMPALLLLTFVQLTALYAVPYVVYLGFGLQGAGFFQLVGTQALVNLAVGSLPLPGAVGASEGSALRAFSMFFGSGLGAPAVLVSRGISFYSFLIISAGVTLGMHLTHREKAPAAPRREKTKVKLPPVAAAVAVSVTVKKAALD